MMSLASAAEALDMPSYDRDVWLSEVSTDSRALNAGALFVALRGPHFDGHQFIADAATHGAAAALVSNAPGAAPLPLLRVEDTVVALARLAGWWRGRFRLPLVGVTGSNGKTTIKEMIGRILSHQSRGLVTRGNLNNHIGVPLTLLRLRKPHRFAVVEMGMNRAGEIARLGAIARPTIALISNAQPSHLEGLGTTRAVALAKGEILESTAAAGVAVLNADDPFYPLWREHAAHLRVRSFGLDNAADVRARWQPCAGGSVVSIDTGAQVIEARLALPGSHNARNAAAAAAAALVAGASPDAVRHGLEHTSAVAGRLSTRRGGGGGLILDDSYNANPLSVRAGLEVLAAYRGLRVAVLGDMAELGGDAPRLHRETGAQARRLGIDALFVLGRLSVETARGFGPGARHFEDHAALLEALRPLDREHTVFLVKGSRSLRMETIVEGLAEGTAAPSGV